MPAIHRSTVLSFLALLLAILPSIIEAQTSPALSSTKLPTTTPTPVTTTISPLEQRVGNLEQKVSNFAAQIEKPKPKDNWDKVSAASGLISGVLIAGIVAIIAHIYQQKQQSIENALKERELKISQAQVIQSFTPNLFSNDERQVTVAIVSIAAIDVELATKLALTFGGETGLDALNKIGASPIITPEQRHLVKERAKEVAEPRIAERLQRLAKQTNLPQEFLNQALKDAARKSAKT